MAIVLVIFLNIHNTDWEGWNFKKIGEVKKEKTSHHALQWR